MISVCQANFVDLHPDEFKDVLENFDKELPKINPICTECRFLDKTACGRSVFKTFVKAPWPISNRNMISVRYLLLDKSPNEHLLFYSEEGNNDYVLKHMTKEDRKKYVLARTFISAFWILPVKEGDEIKGSKFCYVTSMDLCGSIPQFV